MAASAGKLFESNKTYNNCNLSILRGICISISLKHTINSPRKQYSTRDSLLHSTFHLLFETVPDRFHCACCPASLANQHPNNLPLFLTTPFNFLPVIHNTMDVEHFTSMNRNFPKKKCGQSSRLPSTNCLPLTCS